MRFAVALPWWGYALALFAAVACAWWAYVRLAVALTRLQHAVLVSLRAATLVFLVICLLRPVTWVAVEGARDSMVAILLDVSRSMRLADAGEPRLDRARALAADLQTGIGRQYRTDLLTFGESLARADLARVSAEARRSDLSAALSSLADRYKGQPLAGVVVLSDGGDTSAREAGTTQTIGVPVFTVGIGSSSGLPDREILNLTAGEPLGSESSVDLSVTVAGSGYGEDPIELRLTANGRPIESRTVSPRADGAPVHEVFTVSPSADAPTVYAVEIPVEPGELVAENNVRRVLVPPPGRRRRVLVVEGAPGFEHTFLKRALSRDPALEVDSVVRKGQNEEGRDTFFIQAAASRAAALASGYPTTRAELFAYDAILFGNIEGDFFSREQLTTTADFVGARGGGLLVLGARSFERAGFLGTPLEEVLPIDLTDRRVTSARPTGGASPAANTVALTQDGALHPATRLAVTADENRRRWSQLPPLAAVAGTGAPRPGAQVLVVSGGAMPRALIVAQRFGVGRSMIFAGEASWRWRMMRPASDTAHELVWRQVVRWLAGAAGGRVEIPPPTVTLPGTTETISVLLRDDEYRGVSDAEVAIRLRDPGGVERSIRAALAEPREGRYAAAVRFDQAGVYTLTADARRGAETLGSTSRAVLVGGADVELSEPRLNDAVLRRIAASTGGAYLAAADAGSLPALLDERGIGNPPMEQRDLWHTGWSLAAIVALLAAEWLLRRRVGLA
jgi:uncharacterized membrane protein